MNPVAYPEQRDSLMPLPACKVFGGLMLCSTYPACCETEALSKYKAGVQVCYHSLFHGKPE
jgi:hypothetical protein